MNKYKKKKNFLQALFEFRWVICATITLAFAIAPFLIGLFVIKILGIVPEDIIPSIVLENTSANIPFLAFSWYCGFLTMGICFVVVVVVMSLKKLVSSIVIRDLYAAKIMQYLPLTKEDWEQFDAETDEDAILVLRDLVKTVGFRDDLKKCFDLCFEIEKSYKEFLNFKYVNLNFRYIYGLGELICTDDDIIIYVDYDKNLVLCPDAEFEPALKAAREHARKNREIVNTKSKKPLYDKALNERTGV